LNKKRTKPDDVRNSFEVDVLKQLQGRQRSGGYAIAYEEEGIDYVIKHVYIPDFIIEWESGKKRYIESKGYLRKEDARKMIAVKKQHPDLDIRILFQKDKKISKNSRTTYTAWATKNGFDCAVGVIPPHWFNEDA
jgi:predicted nuclease of restriction endonuclease-like RecB superfamily